MTHDCPRCGGTGFALKDRQGIVSAVRCDCERGERNQRLLASARIPRRYEHCTFDTFEEGHDGSLRGALKAARSWAEAWPAVKGGLLLLGPPGTGKTHLAVALAREIALHKGARVLFQEQRELLKSLQGTYETSAALRESEILAPVQEAEVLILDDLGAGRTTPWARDVMHDIISYRYNEIRPLVITSNHPTGDEPEQRRAASAPDGPLTLRDRLGDALMSRLYEMCEVVRLRGKDYRIGVRQHSRSV